MRSAGANTRIVIRSACIVALVCIVSSSLSVSAFDRPAAPGLVFCPLQKRWVKKDVPKIGRSLDALADICAWEGKKAIFLSRLSAKLGGRDLADVSVVSVFLDFVSKGDKALRGIISRPAPPDPLAALSKRSISQLTVRQNLADRVSEQPVIDQFLPCARRSSLTGLFEHEFTELTAIPRAVRPRAPPTLL